jgi:hypothetical protein
MSKFTRAAVAAVIPVAALAIAAGTATAAPAPHGRPAPVAAKQAPAHPAAAALQPSLNRLSTDILPGVHYTSDLTDRSVQITSPIGTLTTQGTRFQVVDPHGRPVVGTGFVGVPRATLPVAAAVPASHAGRIAAPLKPVDATADVNSAVSVAATQFGLATGIGGMVGGIAGVVIGCPLGAVTGGLAGTVFTLPGTVVGGVLGCLAGAGALSSMGAVVGGAVVGIPVGIASAVQAYNTLYAQHDIAAPLR